MPPISLISQPTWICTYHRERQPGGWLTVKSHTSQYPVRNWRPWPRNKTQRYKPIIQQAQTGSWKTCEHLEQMQWNNTLAELRLLGYACPIVPAGWRCQVFDVILIPLYAQRESSSLKIFVWSGLQKQAGAWAKQCIPCQASKVHTHIGTTRKIIHPSALLWLHTCGSSQAIATI